MNTKKNENAQHTPGPWSINSGELRASIEAVNPNFKSPGLTPMESKTRIVASVPFGACGGRHEADARLIASAPELLEALEMLVFIFANENVGRDWINQARAAIAKAKGE